MRKAKGFDIVNKKRMLAGAGVRFFVKAKCGRRNKKIKAECLKLKVFRAGDNNYKSRINVKIKYEIFFASLAKKLRVLCG